MMDKRNISVVIPNFNRYEMVIESFEKVLNDDRVVSFTICDDGSTDDCVEKLVDFFGLKLLEDNGAWMEGPEAESVKFYKADSKIMLVSHSKNVDCFRNKFRSVIMSPTNWCVVLDSDNIIDVDYIDALYAIPEWDTKTFYTPSFAKPHFNFTEYEGVTIDRKNISEYVLKPKVEVCLNAANYFVFKPLYIYYYPTSDDFEAYTSDSIYICSQHIQNNGSIHIVPNMHYEHRIHDGSHYRNNNRRTPKGLHQDIIDKLKNMK